MSYYASIFTPMPSRKLIVAGGLLAIAAALQLFQPDTSTPPRPADRSAWENGEMDARVVTIFRRACKDCHSNETVWPLYARVSPVSWIIANDVHRGRKQLNFSTQKKFSEEQMGEIADEVHHGTMPPKAYLLMHGDAKLSKQDQDLILQWADGALGTK